VGTNLLVSTVRYGGRRGQLDNGEFQVWTLSVDSEKGAVKMALQRFKTPEDYIENDRNPAGYYQPVRFATYSRAWRGQLPHLLVPKRRNATRRNRPTL
jgi:hypothetical protein